MSVQRDIDNELRFHLEARVAELMEQGISRENAHAQALAEFGDVRETRHRLREIDQRVARRRNRAEMIAALVQDVRYAARSLRRSPILSLTIVLTLALGVGVNAAMFSLLDVIYLRPPAALANPDGLRRVWVERQFTDGPQFWPGFDYMVYQRIARSVEGRADALLYSAGVAKLGVGENATRVQRVGTTANYFGLLGLTPQRGRFYTPEEAEPANQSPIVVISDAFWTSHFDRDADVIGKALPLGTQTLTVIGVAPVGFRGVDLDAADLWMPIGTAINSTKPWWQNPAANGFQVLLRLRPGAQDGQIARRITQTLREMPPSVRYDSSSVASLGAINRARGPGRVSMEMRVATRLAGVAIVVLLIACANVINLLLARAMSRRREISVRLALGISRARLIRLLVTEGVLLGALAGIAALAAAWYGGAVLRTLLMPDVAWAVDPLHWRVLAFAAGIAITAGVLTGLVPALQASSPKLADGLKSGVRDSSAHRTRLRTTLVVAQAALSVMLLVGAVLFIRSLGNVKAHDVGYDVQHLAFISVGFDTRDSVRDARLPMRLRALVPEIARIAGVRAVALTSMRPKWGFAFENYYPDADTVRHKKPAGIWTAVTPNYFAVTGNQFLRGTTFSEGTSGQLSVVINQAFADALWPGEDPIGRCVRFGRADNSCATIVGVVGTAIESRLDETATPQFYVSIDNPPLHAWDATAIVVNADEAQVPFVQSAARDILRREFPGGTPSVPSMSELMAPDYRPWLLGAKLFTLFGVLALIVASIGVYSSVSYAVTQRTHEFGVRMALGARAGDVVRQILREGLRTMAIGIVVGAILTLAAGGLLRALLYGVAPNDPLSIGAVALLLLGVSVVATLRPAWRASRLDPVDALRVE